MNGGLTVDELFATLGDYSLVILAIAGVAGLIAKWGIVRPLTVFVDNKLEVLQEKQELRWDSVEKRLGSVEAQMRTNGGSTLRDAVNRIETNQVVDEVVHEQIASALRDLGHPIIIPIHRQTGRHRSGSSVDSGSTAE